MKSAGDRRVADARAAGPTSPTVPSAHALPMHRSPGAGFDQPFEMLAACHDRVHRMVDLLLRLAEHLQTHGADAQARDAARDVMRYFDIAGPAHHEDEERHVFPALLRQPGAPLKPLVRRLLSEHLLLAQQWQSVRADLLVVVAAPDGSGQPGPAVVRRWQDFAALYRSHIQAEDGQAYAAAEGLLMGEERAAMGQEMALRRGATAFGPGQGPGRGSKA
jgi:hemerythrin-like domain-containing protein